MSIKVRYFFELSYSGILFSGSQKQKNSITVFGALEKILKSIFKVQIHLVPCGRTDRGVNAYRSFCHCDFPFDFEPKNVIETINNKGLSLGLFVHNIYLNNDHALSSVVSRTYSYYFTFDRSIPHYLYHSVTLVNALPNFIPTSKDFQQIFIGQKNFFSLCNFGADVKTYLRDIHSISINEHIYTSLFNTNHSIFCIKISANGFLYKMVRHIVGLTLHSMTNFTNISRLIDYFVVHRPMNYSLASVQGLHLTEVNYNNVKVGKNNEKETN